MISQSFLVVVFALVLASPLQVFCFSTQQPTLQQQRIVPTSTELSASSSRRGFLTTGIASGAALVAASVIGQPLPAFADVSDGNSLPQGALQFARLIRVKGDLKVRDINDGPNTYLWEMMKNVPRTQICVSCLVMCVDPFAAIPI